MSCISLQAAATVTGSSKRTLWRRLTSGLLERTPERNQKRSMVALAQIQPQACIPFLPEDWIRLLQADAGNKDAQCDMGLLFLEAGKTTSALYWLERSAKQQSAEALYWLAYLALQQAPHSAPLPANALAQLSQAAQLGHPIAQAQLQHLLPFNG